MAPAGGGSHHGHGLFVAHLLMFQVQQHTTAGPARHGGHRSVTQLVKQAVLLLSFSACFPRFHVHRARGRIFRRCLLLATVGMLFMVGSETCS